MKGYTNRMNFLTHVISLLRNSCNCLYVIVSEIQFAYRRQHSTEDAVVLAINIWQMAKAERKYTGVVMVGMSTCSPCVRPIQLWLEWKFFVMVQ